jgi:hypothetical protein
MKKTTLFFVFLVFAFQFVQAQCVREAPFQDGPDYTVDGSASISFLLDGTKTLSFDSSFSTPAGPDLHVYLSKSATVSTPGGVLQTVNTIDLGLLQSPSGMQTYDLASISPSIEPDSYDYVIIHCKQYNHYWGTGTFGAKSGADCISLRVAEVAAETVIIYPTIIKNARFIIELKKKQKATLKMYSILGEIVQKPLVLIDEINTIDTSALKSGLYILHLDLGQRTQLQKIIIE